MELSNLPILELEAFSRLCEKRKTDLFREMKLYSGDKAIRDKYHKMMDIDDIVTKEIDKRISELIDKKDTVEDEESLESN